MHAAPWQLNLPGGQRLIGAAVHRQRRVAGAAWGGVLFVPREVLAGEAEAWLQHQPMLGAAERQGQPPHQEQATAARVLDAARAGALNTVTGNPRDPRAGALLGSFAGLEQHRELTYIGVKAGSVRLETVEQPRRPPGQAHAPHSVRRAAGALRERVEQSGRRIEVEIWFDLLVVAEAVLD